MSLCACQHDHHVVEICTWDHCLLEGGRHTAFTLMLCQDCHGVTAFPRDNLDIALNEGTAQIKERLREIITAKYDVPRSS